MALFPRVFHGLSNLQLETRDENTTLRFRLTFQSSSRSKPSSHVETVQFDVSVDDAMSILNALQTLQAKHGWHLPSYRRKGRPTLTIVPSGDD